LVIGEKYKNTFYAPKGLINRLDKYKGDYLRLFVFFVLIFSFSYGQEVVHVDERYQSAAKCKVCHKRIVDEWSTSWHSKSHFNSNEYIRKSMKYYARKTRKSLNSVKVQCATCHNPRISVTKTDQDYEIAAIMGLDKGSKVNKAVNDDSIAEGINCVVCHNIDKIHDEYDASKRGIDRVEWTPSGTMTGPYKDAKSPYHKTIYHDFMSKTPNRLCFVCHANDRSVKGLVFTNMEKEYKSNKSCVSCHMGPQRHDVAATYSFNGKKKIRNVRNHGFMGAHIESMWQGALDIKVQVKGNKLVVNIINPQPHNIPSGFGGRELILDIKYKDANAQILKQRSLSLTTTYKRRRDKVSSTPHLAEEASKSLSIPANSKKSFVVKRFKGASSVEVVLSYKLVNDEIRKLLDLKDPIYSKKFFIKKAIKDL